MALVSFTQGLKKNLPTSSIIEGALYLTTDTGEMYYGKSISELLKITDTDSVKNVSFTQSLTSGTEIGKLTVDNTTYTLYSQTDTDYLVKQTPSTSSLEHPLLASSVGAGGASSALTTEAIFAAGMTINPSTNTITATNFAGTATAANSLTIGAINTGENLNNYFEQNHFKFYNAPALTTNEGMPTSSALLGDSIAVQSYPLSTTKQIQEVVDAEGKMHVRVKDSVANDISDWRVMCSIKEGIAVGNETTPVYIKADGTPEPVNIDVNVFIVQNTKPTNHKKLWIDTTAKTGGLKYYSEELQDWTHVPVAWV